MARQQKFVLRDPGSQVHSAIQLDRSPALATCIVHVATVCPLQHPTGITPAHLYYQGEEIDLSVVRVEQKLDRRRVSLDAFNSIEHTSIAIAGQTEANTLCGQGFI